MNKGIIILIGSALAAGAGWFFFLRKPSSTTTTTTTTPDPLNKAGAVPTNIVATQLGENQAAPLKASFNSTMNYLSATFANTSTGTKTGSAWDFGDGTKSTEANPTHVYAKDGTYNVTLTVKGSGVGKIDSISQPVTVAHQPTIADKYEGKSIKTAGADPIFFVKKGIRYHIPDAAFFRKMYGLGANDAWTGYFMEIPSGEMVAIPFGGELTDAIYSGFSGFAGNRKQKRDSIENFSLN